MKMLYIPAGYPDILPFSVDSPSDEGFSGSTPAVIAFAGKPCMIKKLMLTGTKVIRINNNQNNQ